METIAKIQPKALPHPSPLEWLARQVSRLPVPRWLVAFALAVLLAALAEVLALHVSRIYYEAAPYDWDSVGYRHGAVNLYKTAETEGVWAALRQRFAVRDGLDQELRLLFAPRTLLSFNGHMVALFPYLATFFFLLIWYVYVRAGSLLLGVAAASFVFTLPVIYDPMVFGISDYDLNPLSTWLWVSAAVAWLLSDRLTRPGWSFLCSFLLGLLVVQRTANAVIVAPIFLPIVLWTFYRRLALDGWRRALLRIAWFVLPAAVLGGLVAYCQWDALYQYYFVSGAGQYHSYGAARGVFDTYWGIFLSYKYKPTRVALGIALAVCLFGISSWRQWREMLTAAWLVAGVPLVVVGILVAIHNGFFPLWEPTFVIFLAVAIPWSLSPGAQRLLAAVLLAVGISAAAVQYQWSIEAAKNDSQVYAPTRALYQNLRDIILAQPDPHFGLFFGPEKEEIFWNHLYFGGGEDKGVDAYPEVTMASRDNDWIAAMGDIPPEETVNIYMNKLEGFEGALAVIQCDREGVIQVFDPSTTHYPDRIPYSQKVALGIYDHLLTSNHWKGTYRIKSPVGDLYVFQYASTEMTAAEKWGDLQSEIGLTEVLLASPVAPGVRIFRYTSLIEPQVLSGLLCQNLPAGKGGGKLSVYSDAERTVIFHATASPVPAESQDVHTLILAVGGKETPVQVQGEQEIRLPVALRPGLNEVEWYVEGPAPAPAADQENTPQPVLLLTSPQFIPGP